MPGLSVQHLFNITVEMMAAVIALLHQLIKTPFRDLLVFGGSTHTLRMFLTIHNQIRRETRKHISVILVPSVYCVYDSEVFWQRVE